MPKMDWEKDCGTPSSPGKAPICNTFRAGFYEHAASGGVHAETAQDLQDACNERGLVSDYIENSSFGVRRDYDRYEENHAKLLEREAARDERSDRALQEFQHRQRRG